MLKHLHRQKKSLVKASGVRALAATAKDEDEEEEESQVKELAPGMMQLSSYYRKPPFTREFLARRPHTRHKSPPSKGASTPSR